MRNRARNWAAALVAAVLVVALTSSGAAAQNDGCSAVLSQGIYNKVTTSSSSSSYSQAHTSSCNVDTSYTYDSYAEASKTEKQSGMDVQVDVAASYMGFRGSSSVGVKTNALDKNEFAQAMSRIASYQKNQCQQASSTSVSDADIRNMQSWVDPNVVQAWRDCMALGQKGLKATVKTDVDGTSFNADFIFTQAQYKGEAMLTGIGMRPARSAECNIWGPGLSRTVYTSSPLNITMAAQSTYTVMCYTVGVFDQPTDIYIGTTLGTYQARIYRRASTTIASQLQAQINDLARRVANLESTALKCNGAVCQVPDGRALQIGNWVMQRGVNGALDIQNNGTTRASIDTNGLLSVTTGDKGGIRIGDYCIFVWQDGGALGVLHKDHGFRARMAVDRNGGLYAGPAGLKTEGGRWTFENGDGDRRTLRIVRDGSIWAGTVTENNVLYFSNMELAPNGNFKTGPTRMFAWPSGNIQWRHDNGRWNEFLFDHGGDAARFSVRQGAPRDGYRSFWGCDGKHDTC